MRLFPFTFWHRKQSPEPVVVEQPPAVIDEKIPEERLRAMYRIGVIAGYKQAREEQEAAKHKTDSFHQKPAQPVLQMPLQQASKPQQTPIPMSHRAGGWMYTERASRRVAAKIGQSIIPVRPRFHNVPTVADMPAMKLPDAG